MGTGVTPALWSPELSKFVTTESVKWTTSSKFTEKSKVWSSNRLISTGKLNLSPDLHFRPIDLVVYQEPLVPANRDMDTWF